jgi:hypothetical protein
MVIFVADTTVLMDMTKPESATDVPAIELQAARVILVQLLSGDSLQLAYSNGMLSEWVTKGLLEEDAIVRTLMDQDKFRKVKAMKISGGKIADLQEYVDFDDQVFVLSAAALPDQMRPCVTRDPKTTRKGSRREVKRLFGVTVLLASEFAA